MGMNQYFIVDNSYKHFGCLDTTVIQVLLHVKPY